MKIYPAIIQRNDSGWWGAVIVDFPENVNFETLKRKVIAYSEIYPFSLFKIVAFETSEILVNKDIYIDIVPILESHSFLNGREIF